MNVLPNAERFRAIIRTESRDFSSRIWRILLWWIRWPYAFGVWVRNKLYDWRWKQAVRVPATVISVGNLSLGGTGKTPCVEYLARELRTLGRSVAIISRGYGSAQGPNDEALMLEENLPDVPHLQNPDRVQAALAAVTELESEILLLDDGFQHRRLHRDLNIVLLDSSTPLLAEYLFPRGTLREPIASLHRADVIILTRCEDPAIWVPMKHALSHRFPEQVIIIARHEPTMLVDAEGNSYPLELASGRPLALICGIGHPEAFARTVAQLMHPRGELNPSVCRHYPDHHPYSRTDVEQLQEWAATLPKEALILTTQKDLVKLRLQNLADRALLAVRIEFRIVEGEAQLLERLHQILPPWDEA